MRFLTPCTAHVLPICFLNALRAASISDKQKYVKQEIKCRALNGRRVSSCKQIIICLSSPAADTARLVKMSETVSSALIRQLCQRRQQEETIEQQDNFRLQQETQ
jgi:hypothetical protein